jgi:hypothetical protein
MNRRDFLGVATMLIPSLRLLRLDRKREIDLTKFCATDECYTRRWDMKSPFKQGDFTYATDSKICLRIDQMRGDDGPKINLPPANRLPWKADGGEWKPLRPIRTSEQYDECGTCYGGRIDGMGCPDCNARGEVLLHTDAYLTDDLRVDNRYLDLIRREIGSAEWKPHRALNYANHKAPIEATMVAFRWPGGCGLLSPLMGKA